jgi:hypothetical protein
VAHGCNKPRRARNFAVERRIAEALGVMLDFSKGEGGKVYPSDEPAAKDKEDANA